MKRAAATPQPSLGRSVVVCRPVCLVRVADPSKLFPASFPWLSRNRQGKTTSAGRSSYLSRRVSQPLELPLPEHHPTLPSFPETRASRGNDCRPGPLGRRMVSALSMHCPAERRDRSAPPNRLHPEAAGSASPGRQCPGRQFIPISTAILIKSEWFFAPSFCLSRDVVLATVL